MEAVLPAIKSRRGFFPRRPKWWKRKVIEFSVQLTIALMLILTSLPAGGMTAVRGLTLATGYALWTSYTWWFVVWTPPEGEPFPLEEPRPPEAVAWRVVLAAGCLVLWFIMAAVYLVTLIIGLL